MAKSGRFRDNVVGIVLSPGKISVGVALPGRQAGVIFSQFIDSDRTGDKPPRRQLFGWRARRNTGQGVDRRYM
jgi:hypothetical protein